jgi:hypothetical protein
LSQQGIAVAEVSVQQSAQPQHEEDAHDHPAAVADLGALDPDELVQGEAHVEHEREDVDERCQEGMPQQGRLGSGEDQEEVQEHRRQHETGKGADVLGR